MTRIERRNARRRQRTHRICAACAGLLIASAIAAVSLLQVGSDANADTMGSAPSAAPAEASTSMDKPAVTELPETPAECLARMLWGEARGCSTTEQAAVVWCALNRVDSEDPYYPDDIVSVVTQDLQFHGYDPDNPVMPELLSLVEDVLARWSIEDGCVGNVGRVLPKEYLYFTGDGMHNYFRTEYQCGETWGWGLESPYGEG